MAAKCKLWGVQLKGKGIVLLSIMLALAALWGGIFNKNIRLVCATSYEVVQNGGPSDVLYYTYDEPTTTLTIYPDNPTGDRKESIYDKEEGWSEIETSDDVTHEVFMPGEDGTLLSPEDLDSLIFQATTFDFSGLDTQYVTLLQQTFSNNSNVVELDLSNFNTSQATSMWGMFQGCTSLQSVNVSSFDTSSVTNMTHMFAECSALKCLDLSSFNTSMVTDMSSMCVECVNLTTFTVSPSFTTDSAWNFNQMFWGCSELESLDLASFTFKGSKNVPEGEDYNMENMFDDCSALTYLDISGLDFADFVWMPRSSWDMNMFGNSEPQILVISHGIAKEVGGEWLFRPPRSSLHVRLPGWI